MLSFRKAVISRRRCPAASKAPLRSYITRATSNNVPGDSRRKNKKLGLAQLAISKRIQKPQTVAVQRVAVGAKNPTDAITLLLLLLLLSFGITVCKRRDMGMLGSNAHQI